MQTFTSISEARRNSVAQGLDIGAQDQTVSGRNVFSGIGRVFFNVKFPVLFSGRPVPLFGAELDETSPFAALGGTTAPQATCLVAGWERRGQITGAFEGYFTGAVLLAVIKGSPAQTTWITWHFHGPAIRNPTGEEEVEVL